MAKEDYSVFTLKFVGSKSNAKIYMDEFENLTGNGLGGVYTLETSERELTPQEWLEVTDQVPEDYL